MTLGGYVRRQQEWSERTFGPGRRTVGILEHIRKELGEIEAAPEDLSEWVDVIILALDGYWRHGGEPMSIMRLLVLKQVENFARGWPPIQPENVPTEHIRAPLEGHPIERIERRISRARDEKSRRVELFYALTRIMESLDDAARDNPEAYAEFSSEVAPNLPVKLAAAESILRQHSKENSEDFNRLRDKLLT